MSNERLVVTGMGAVSSLGHTVQGVWDAVLQGKGGLTRVDGFSADDPRGVAAPVIGLDPSSLGVDARDSRIMGTHSHMLMKATRDAFESARLDSVTFPRDAIAYFAGMGMIDYHVDDLLPAVRRSVTVPWLVDFSLFHAEGYKDIHPLWPLSMLNNISFCQVAIALDIQGENAVFSPHAEAGASAVAESMTALQEGRALLALAAGVSEKISELSLTRALLSGVLSQGDRRLISPGGSSADPAAGIGLGEGCGVVAMERLSSARERGAEPLAVVGGHASTFESDPDSVGPSVRAIATAIEETLAAAGTRPDQIDALIIDGASASGGDSNEFEALIQVFGARTPEIPAFCSKGAMGHTLAGAPLLDLVLAVSMLREGVVPPTLHLRVAEGMERPRMVTGLPLKIPLRQILVNCRNCEGHAASLVLQEFPD